MDDATSVVPLPLFAKSCRSRRTFLLVIVGPMETLEEWRWRVCPIYSHISAAAVGTTSDRAGENERSSEDLVLAEGSERWPQNGLILQRGRGPRSIGCMQLGRGPQNSTHFWLSRSRALFSLFRPSMKQTSKRGAACKGFLL